MIAPIDPTKNPARVCYRVPKIVVAVHKVGGGGDRRNLPNKIQEESVSDLSVAFRRPGPAIASVDSDHFSPS